MLKTIKTLTPEAGRTDVEGLRGGAGRTGPGAARGRVDRPRPARAPAAVRSPSAPRAPWRSRREIGEAGLDAPAARHGLEAVPAERGGARPEDRSTAVRLRDRAGEDVIDALADPDRQAAFRAQQLLTDPERLRRHLAEAPTEEAKLWAVYARHRLTEDADETRKLYEELGRPRVEVGGLDEELRAAIVHEYGRWCEEWSDPRWRIEALCTDPPPAVDTADQLRRATAALTAAGLAPKPPLSCGEDDGVGDGTYHVIGFDDGGSSVFISTLGPFIAGDDESPQVRRALESVGFRRLDEAVRSIKVTDLGVYYFGSRGPLGVDTLLFHRQDWAARRRGRTLPAPSRSAL
ncbi:hypothetical protein [Streptomyces sp. NPDC089795]|uniref:hypothetical protein n=1 Tax=Streptomyces sp. NPDC089795 TaxID=3155297 RepID=UPI003424DBF5